MFDEKGASGTTPDGALRAVGIDTVTSGQPARTTDAGAGLTLLTRAPRHALDAAWVRSVASHRIKLFERTA